MAIDLETVATWEPIIEQLVALGVRSFDAIKALMQDAGADDETIAALQPQWDALLADVKRAAGDA